MQYCHPTAADAFVVRCLPAPPLPSHATSMKTATFRTVIFDTPGSFSTARLACCSSVRSRPCPPASPQAAVRAAPATPGRHDIIAPAFGRGTYGNDNDEKNNKTREEVPEHSLRSTSSTGNTSDGSHYIIVVDEPHIGRQRAPLETHDSLTLTPVVARPLPRSVVLVILLCPRLYSIKAVL